jgi:hypothetical protein
MSVRPVQSPSIPGAQLTSRTPIPAGLVYVEKKEIEKQIEKMEEEDD